ncbi:MAG: hypothetical protein KDD55_07440 [Bdellovibrionales bacterium]|nr:hypothetical protein [Bdellovibrionales bacterium]
MNALRSYFRFNLGDLVLAGIALSLLPGLFESFANDPGLGWHLKSGQLMLKEGPLFADPFLATPSPLPWVPDQWLGSLILAFFFGLGGWPLLYSLVYSVIVATFFVSVFFACKLRTQSPLLCSFGVLLAVKLSSIQLFIRPLVLSFLFLSWLCVFLFSRVKSLREGREFWTRGDMLFLPSIFAVWANIHPYFVLGIIVLGLAYLGVLADSYFLSKPRIPRLVRSRILLTVFLVTAATFLTPYGFELHRAIFGLGTSDFFTNFLSEWKPIRFADPEGQLFEIYVGVILFGYLSSQKLRSEWGFFELLTCGALLHFTLGSIRGMPIFCIFSAPLFVEALGEFLNLQWFRRFFFVRRFSQWLQPYLKYEQSSRSTFFVAGVFCFAFLVPSFITGRLPLYSGEVGPSRERFPYDAVAWLKEQARETGHPVQVLNFLDWGGFLALYGYPELKYVVDDRLTLRSEEFYREYWKTFHGSGRGEDFLRENPSDFILFSSANVLDAKLDCQLEVFDFGKGKILKTSEYNPRCFHENSVAEQ